MFHMTTELYGKTGTKVLNTAEALFAEFGYNGVSLRRITADAGVNLAAVNYHYSDKQSLYLEIVTYRLRQLSRARLECLAAAEGRAGSALVPLEEIVDALAVPLLQPDESAMPSFGPASRRLLGRVLIEPLDFLVPALAADFQPAVARCGQAVRRRLPALPPADFLWQYSFVIGALHHAAAALHGMKTLTTGICANEDTEAALRNFRRFALAALAGGD